MMIHIDENVREVMAHAQLSFVATIDPEGSPSLSPKASVRVYDSTHIAFMDINSAGTIENLRHDSRIEINSVDFLRRLGYRLRGRAEFRDPGDEVFEWLHNWLLEINGPGYPANRAVLVHVDRVLPVLSPAYTFGGKAEQEVAESSAHAYGLR
jgi:predicted pyridoxine 5'-phosphate oxidase superfamily flavin-nucleotide-binding protein